MPILSLMTDFGIKDGNVGVMKGVIWQIAPAVQIADLSHQIGPQNIAEAALVLARATPYFPAGSLHLVVVDPGVGTARRPLAAQIGNQWYVGPDNGTITRWLQQAQKLNLPTQFVHLNKPEFWLKEISHVFHGRDIFAPSAAHLISGTPLMAMGEPITDPVLLNLPEPYAIANGWRGEIIHVDHFGNLSSNIRMEHLEPLESRMQNAFIQIGHTEIHGMVHTFGERPPGELIALVGSTGNLIISTVNGNAQKDLNAHTGDPIQITF